MENYREVTDKEKATIESKDAAWSRPPQSFIDMWNKAAAPEENTMVSHFRIGQYNENTGYFELNGLRDITYEQALEIYRLTTTQFTPQAYCRAGIRTNFVTVDSTLAGYGYDENESPRSIFRGSAVEVARVSLYDKGYFWGSISGMFYECKKLVRVLGILGQIGTSAKPIRWRKCPNLEEVYIERLKNDLELNESVNISLDSLMYAVEYAHNSTPITITVHPDVFAKITDETNTEWHALMELAEQKNITFST